jgi:thioredoxin reductase (NADPH)
MGTPTFGSLRAQTSCRVARNVPLSLPAWRVLIFGRDRDADCHDIRAFLSANRIPYEWVDRDRQPERVRTGVSDDPDCPAASVDGQLFIEPPTTREVANALQLQTRPNRGSYDVVIVGAGPAGVWPPAFMGVLKG